jgi:hypothetical protein
VQRLLSGSTVQVLPGRASRTIAPVQRVIRIGNDTYKSRSDIIEKKAHYKGETPTETSVIDELFQKFKSGNQSYSATEWQTEVVMRAAIIDGMEQLNKESSPFHYNMNTNELKLPNRWQAVGAFHTEEHVRVEDQNTAFAPKAGTVAVPNDSLEAINQVFTLSGGNTEYYLDCSTASVLTVYRGFAQALESLDPGSFSDYFPPEDVVIHPEGVEGVTVPNAGQVDREPPSKELMDEIDLSNRKDLQPGDLVYWRNFADYEETHGGTENAAAAWAGEWSVYMGNDKFQGFGVPLSSFEDMVAKLMNSYNAGLPKKTPKKTDRERVNQQRTGIETMDSFLPGIDKSIRRPRNPAAKFGIQY